jgi:two-component system OmpR family sensor kinase
VKSTDARTEVGQLGLALNTMLTGIEGAFAAQAASEERLRRFLADASHELRTPLTSIRGYAELFDRGARDRPEDLATSMRHIREEASRMSVLVDDLLLLARLDHQRPLALEPVELTDLVTAAVGAAQVSAPGRAVTLEVSGPVPVVGDADRLRQVVDNLLANAVQHTPETAAVDVRVRAEASTACLEVSDRGPGIAPEEQAHIFEPFHRSDPTRARATGGVGLGLSIVSAIAHAHGGTVGVVSPSTTSPEGDPGGTTFWVRIPLARPAVSDTAVSDVVSDEAVSDAAVSDAGHAGETGVAVDEGELGHAGRAVAVLGDDDLGGAPVR